MVTLCGDAADMQTRSRADEQTDKPTSKTWHVHIILVFLSTISPRCRGHSSVYFEWVRVSAVNGDKHNNFVGRPRWRLFFATRRKTTSRFLALGLLPHFINSSVSSTGTSMLCPIFRVICIVLGLASYRKCSVCSRTYIYTFCLKVAC